MSSEAGARVFIHLVKGRKKTGLGKTGQLGYLFATWQP
jgi:hypothetical protein